ncbi:hypothetical protein [Amycolatopsis anabasis]|uniref:hypothetical protein n=1 Tax=Amycolatopsis anabasis TaxID=1840409 RepID=UPI00131AFF21|nr:hypothetical protein [Amycolatopsis anabasis]
MKNAAEIRASVEKARAAAGATLPEDEWAAIVGLVDSAPPLPDEVIRQVSGLLRPVTLPPAAAAEPASTRRHPDARPRRRRRTGRAA